MNTSISTIPRWLIAVAVGALILSIAMLSGPGDAGAQDSTPSATPEATETATATATPDDTQSAEVTTADTSTVEAAQADHAVGDELVVADGPLNVREEAGLDADVVVQLAAGSLVQITDGPETADDLTWYEIETTEGDTGWVADDFLGTDRDASFAVGDVVIVADGPVNMRDGAGLDADVLFQLDTGAEVEITGGPETADDYTWYEILTADDETGWVAGEFLGTGVVSTGFSADDEVVVADGPLNVRDDSSLDGEVLLQLENGEGGTILSGPVSADGYNWYEIQIDSETSGWVAGEFLALADDASGEAIGSDGDFAIGDAIRVSVEDLNFRADAGLDAEVLDTLDLDALFLVQDGPVSADGYTWYQVFNYYYGEGWVAGELMTLDPAGFPVEEGT